MVFKAYRRGLTVSEIPIDYYPRVGESKLNRFGDAWRHVRFMLLYSPSWLYLVPGAALLLLGIVGMLVLATGPVDVFGRTWQIHTMLGFVALTLIGAQVIQLGVFARTYARVRIGEHDPLLERLGRAAEARARPARRRRCSSSSRSPGSFAVGDRVGARRLRHARARRTRPRSSPRGSASASRSSSRRSSSRCSRCRCAASVRPSDGRRARLRPAQRARAQRAREAARARRAAGSACSTSAARADISRGRWSQRGCTVVGLELDPDRRRGGARRAARRCSSATSRRWSCRSTRARSTSCSAAT